MIKIVCKIFLPFFFLLLLTACSSAYNSSSQQPVAVAENQLFHQDTKYLSVSRGPLIDGLVGQEIDQIMDYGDRLNMIVAIIRPPINQTTSWINYRRHVRYQVAPVRINWTEQGSYCREYQVVVLMSNEMKRGQGRLCRIGKNTWQILPLVNQFVPNNY